MKLSKEIKTAILTITAAVMVIWGFNYLKGRNIFVGRTHFYAVYKSIDGLMPNNPVLINGFRVGQVKEIYFVPDNSGRIILHMVLNNTEMQVPKNTIAEIYNLDMLGAKGVQLKLGNSIDLAETGDTLMSGIQPSMMSEVTGQLMPVKTKAENLIVSLDSIVLTTRKIFDEKTQNNLKATLENIRGTAESVDGLMASEKERLGDIFENIESITNNVKKNNDKLSNVIKNFSSLSDSLAKSNIASTINNVDRTMKETSAIMAKINRGEGSLGLLVNNDSLYKHLDAASNDLDLLLADMKKHPKRYVHFSLFGKKDKQ